jgi:hypothetical protein
MAELLSLLLAELLSLLLAELLSLLRGLHLLSVLMLAAAAVAAGTAFLFATQASLLCVFVVLAS